MAQELVADWHVSFYTLLLLIGALPSLIAAAWSMRYRDRPGGTPLALLMLAIAVWCVTGALEAAAWDVEIKVLWSQISYIGIVNIPVLMFLFAYEFAHRGAFRRRWAPLLWVVPIAALAFAATNNSHYLLWSSYTPIDLPSGRGVIYGHGPAFWLFWSYAAALVLAGMTCFIRGAIRFRGLYRRQAVALLLISLIGWLPNVAYVAGLDPVSGRDWSPAAFVAAGLLLVWSFDRQQLLDVIPVARDRVIEQMQSAVIVVDADDRVIDLNPAAAQLLGLGRGEAYGRALLECAPWLQSVEGSEIALDDGHYVEYQSSQLRKRNGELRARVFVIRDVTERVTAHCELQALNASLETQVAARTAEVRMERDRIEGILRSVGEGILVMDEVRRVMYTNPEFSVLTGYELSEMSGRDPRDLVIGRDPAASWPPSKSLEAGASHWQGEVAILRKDGNRLDVAMTVAPLHASGSPSGYVVTLRDMTQRKQLERARSRFLDNVSHQFRTPVATLQLQTFMMKRMQLPDKAHEYLHAMEDQIAWLSHLISDVMEMTALDTGRGVASWDVLSLSALVETVLVHHGGQAVEADVRLSVDASGIDDEIPAVRGDQARLTQALNEVVENALTFTPAGGSVTMRLGLVERGGRKWATIAVCDTGPGLTEEDRTHAFDRFYRGRAAAIANTPGTGLGLSIVREIVRAHGGRITLASDGKSGSIFTLWFPAVPPVGAGA